MQAAGPIIKTQEYLFQPLELINGGDLKQLMEKSGPFKGSTVKIDDCALRRIITHMLLGLQSLHSMHVIHSDLKEENVMIRLRDGV